MNRRFQILRVSVKPPYWLGLLPILFLFFQSCQLDTSTQYQTISIQVDTAQLDETGKKFLFFHKDSTLQEFSVGGYISDKEALSGDYSVLLTGKKLYGLSTKFHDLKGNEHFIISVWRKDASKKAALVVQGDKTRSLYIALTDVVEKRDDGWERLELDLEVPPNIVTITIYAWKIGADSAFFDDLVIQKLPPKEYPAYAAEPKLHLYFSDKKMQKFEEKRVVAFDAGVHLGDGEWMKGIMSNEENVMPIKARFKGDWLDHLMGSKWSFRIKMRDDFTFNRMRVFSVQSPITRYYLNEYFAHQLFTQEDVLTTRYGFVPLYLNGKSLGIYAWEEHFAKQLVEYNLRREGPILKIDEDPLWNARQYLGKKMDWPDLPYYESARVLSFGMSKTLEKPSLKAQFNIASSLMLQYKNRKAPIEEIFNIDILAKFWALIDVTNGRHGVAWHNQRMYYNPVLCKLEPINFDNFTDYFTDTKRALISSMLVRRNDTTAAEHALIKSIFSSPVFVEAYIPYLEKYSEESFLKNFMNSQRDEINRYEAMIQLETEDYSFDESYFYRNAADIRNELPLIKKKYEEGFFNDMILIDRTKVADTNYYPELIPAYVNAYYYPSAENNAQLLLENYNGVKIEIVGLANSEDKMVHVFDDRVSLNAFAHHVDDAIISVAYFEDAKKLAFRVYGHNDIFYSELSLWEKNMNLSPYQKLSRSFELASCELFDISGDSLIIKAGKYKLNSKVLIPSDRILVIEAGVELDIIQNATIISHAPVFMNGTKENPIRIYSSDSTANAFTVLQAKGVSELHHVVFSHLNTLEYEGWTLTGAVNFYESDVLISDCVFEHNHCEDALNIIRSDFLVTQSQFFHIFSDAFDSDFCTGTLEKSSFQYVGNDAIDFSTSQITINNCDIKNIGDKGISGGEGSTLLVTHTKMFDCNIGVASKDISVVELLNCSIEDCNYGLVALRKKPEYGPAILKTTKLNIINCSTKHLIEKSSRLEYNGRKIEGVRPNVAVLFY